MASFEGRRLQLLLLGVVGAASLLALALIAAGGLGGASALAAPRGHSASAPGRPADSVAAFAKVHGDPPDATHGRIRIPAISVNAPLSQRTVPAVAPTTMPEPSGPTDVVYYDMSQWPGLGGAPGEGRNAIFAGHVDLRRPVAYANGAPYQGPAVFWALEKLRPGDTIEVSWGGRILKYAVVSVKELPASTDTDWRAIWSGDVKRETVTLFTCGGSFDAATHAYGSRIIVRAERV